MQIRFRIVNVFTVGEDRFSGNPLCVFEDGRGLSTETMQALARQFNLSETTFLLPADDATAAVRIFTPAMELPFAGHPTLGSAQVVQDLYGTGTRVTLSMSAGVIAVESSGRAWTLEAGEPRWQSLEPGRIDALVAALGLERARLAGEPMWVSTGMEQLLVPLDSAAAVASATPGAALAGFANGFGKVGVYLFSPLDLPEQQVRFFFGKAGGALMEDPATGSACANLGGYALATGRELPLRRTLHQGETLSRPSRLGLSVDAGRRILVSGEVLEIGRGSIDL